ncbi:hypothetical protein BDV29DRAFT_157284 [Aspergillus leporis]|uniref:Uncharacterized protein n=1 Tax=Aspergillus leporis TaxID=41062 RepID=A0A5N5X358_9EURO|nr:hypothetical protein BDV29DRAFT_157284 [Aspergillus leporis]
MAQANLIDILRNAARTHASRGILTYPRGNAHDPSEKLTYTKLYAPRKGCEHKIHVNALCPGYFQTGMTQSLFVNADVMAYMQAITPYWTGNNTLRNVVKAALFLVSPDAMWLTGVALEEDGGATA